MTNEWLQRPPGKRNHWRKWGGVLLIALCLFAPSLWMLATIPPLWKDVDAYVQVTSPPGSDALLLYGPLSCFLPRIPLYAGYAYDCLRTGSSLPSFIAFLAQPVLCDSGVASLIFLQHAALCGSACFLICSATRLFAVRFVLAILWAANPLFYVWAHCVGSETLSLILVLLLATVGLRIATTQGRVRFRAWFTFAFLLTLTMLTRHINGVLAALLPLTFGFVWLTRFAAAVRTESMRTRRLLRHRATRDLRNAFVALAVGIICIIATNMTLRSLSHLAGIHYRTTVGFTFMFRLNFLASFSPEDREHVLSEVADRSKSEDVRTLLGVFRTAPFGLRSFDTMALLDTARTRLRPEEPDAEERLNELLNQTARSFLIPPRRELLHAAVSDFLTAQTRNIPRVVRHPFGSTLFYFRYPQSMPACASLTTFRDHSSDEIPRQIQRHAYLRVGKRIVYYRLLLFSGVAVLLVIFLKRGRVAAIPAYATALTLIGLLMMFANCLLNEFQARYTLPMWELTIIATTILLGAIVQSLRFVTQKKKASQPNRLEEARGFS
jgi:hypothetical protein